MEASGSEEPDELILFHIPTRQGAQRSDQCATDTPGHTGGPERAEHKGHRFERDGLCFSAEEATAGQWHGMEKLY